MKILMLFLPLSILVYQHLYAQDQGNRLLIEEYIQQSAKQKNTGLTMVIAGTAAIGIGYLMANNASLDEAAFGAGILLTLGGGASTLIGIPILISSGVKARRAAELSLQADRIQNPSNLGLQTKVIPSVGISIPLNTKYP